MEDIMEDNFEKLNLLLEQEQCEFVDIPDGFTGQTESGELRLIYLMNDAVESFLVLKNARMTGNYVRDYEGEFEGSIEKADRDLCEAEYILVVHQGQNVFTVFFEDILMETHLYNYGELGHFWVKGYEKEYPDADCTLDYDNAWKLLVSVRLAAQCTDARVNVVVQDLYAKFPTVEALANADVADIEAIVRPCGLGKSKARDISACMKILHEQYHDNVPGDFDALLKLPGVGRKSANLIMGDVFGKPAIVTDTHCIRLSNRIGLVDNMKEPKKVEMALWKIIPPEEGNDLCHRLVNHGRDVCTARTKPYCDRCCLNDICEKNGVDSQE